MKWSNLTIAGRIIILTLLALAAIGVLGAQGMPQSGYKAGDKISDARPPDNTPPATKELKPSEVQSLRLQVKQRDALLAKANLESAQRQFQQALTDLTAEGEKTKIENGWGKNVAFDPNTLGFSEAPSGPSSKDKNSANPKN